ncbi:hypothetical protein Zm00014a_044314 [Zea mays]|uniref:Uncharacterized protein n=2 Tax=Zea mays TaxID=4577 RepID=A0A3L6FDR4_MAIZE|nr:hypothetical protein ZEAMMB73_Zm00001d040032 [Zea mays]PWZ30958.1 hypothetical protein Zm00014a_044314 [Zea mays]
MAPISSLLLLLAELLHHPLLLQNSVPTTISHGAGAPHPPLARAPLLSSPCPQPWTSSGHLFPIFHGRQ